MEDKIKINRNTGDYGKLIFVAPVAVYFATRSGYHNILTRNSIRLLLGVALLLFALLMIVFFVNAIKELRKGKIPALIVDKFGITDNISMANTGLISWNEIEKFEFLQNSGQPNIFIFVKDNKRILKNSPRFRRGMLKQLHKDKGSPIAINLKHVDMNYDELITLFKAMHKLSRDET